MCDVCSPVYPHAVRATSARGALGRSLAQHASRSPNPSSRLPDALCLPPRARACSLTPPPPVFPSAQVKKDDLVLLGDFSGEQVDYCGTSHQFLPEESILGVFEGGVSGSVNGFRPLRDLLLVKITE